MGLFEARLTSVSVIYVYCVSGYEPGNRGERKNENMHERKKKTRRLKKNNTMKKQESDGEGREEEKKEEADACGGSMYNK